MESSASVVDSVAETTDVAAPAAVQLPADSAGYSDSVRRHRRRRVRRAVQQADWGS